MENKSVCPYCGKEMHLGYIPQDRYALKWIPDKNFKGLLFQWFAEGIKLTGMGTKGSVEASYCKNCEKIIIDTEDKKNQI